MTVIPRPNIPSRNAQPYPTSIPSVSVEPLASYAHFCLGQEYPGGFLEYAWKLLLKNHPHDSICGCSTDRVHRQMEPRFDGVIETGERVIRNTLERTAPMFSRDASDDADVVIAGLFSTLGASHALLVLAEMGLLPVVLPRAAVDEVKKVMDWAAELSCPYIDVWPGQDGFDYCFQTDYLNAWKWMHDGLAQCAEHNDGSASLSDSNPRVQ